MKHSTSLPITSSDGGDESSRSSTCRHALDGDNSKSLLASFVASFALTVASATVAYNNYYTSTNTNTLPRLSSSGTLIVPADDRRARQLQQHIEKRSLQRFGDDGDAAVTTSSFMTEDPVIHTYGFAGLSDADVHNLLFGDSDTREDVVIPMAEQEPIVEVDSAAMDEIESVPVTVDQAAPSRRRNAVAAKQTLFSSDEQVVVSFMNALDVQPGDFVAVVPSNIDVSDGLRDDDFVDYTYVCEPGSEPIDCPRYGSVSWDPSEIPSGRYMAYLAKEDSPEPYTIKSATTEGFMVRRAVRNRVEIIEPVAPAPTPAPPTPVPPTPAPPTPVPPTIPPPTEDPNGSLGTL